MRRKKLAQGICILASVIFVCVGSLWYRAHMPIAYHNRSLREAIDSATRIEIVTKGPEIVPVSILRRNSRKVVVSNRDEIAKFLGNLLLPWYAVDSGKFHECGGHLRITIDMPDSLQLVMHYDHGEGIYPIRPEGHLTGFMVLSEGARSRLNDYFNSLGYDEEDLGITH